MVMLLTRLFALQVSMDKIFTAFKNLDDVPSRYIDINNDYIKLTAVAGGKPSSNSKYSRTEFRQVDKDGKNTYWDSDSKTSMYGRLSVDKLPKVKKSVMFSQIKLKTHGAVLMMFLRERQVYMVCNTAKFKLRNVIDTEYSLGDIISFSYSVDNSNVTVRYCNEGSDASVKINYRVEFSNAYFKVGNYMQSASPPEDKDSTTIVTLYSVGIM